MASPTLAAQHTSNTLHFTLPGLPVARVLHQIRTLPEATRPLIRDTLGYS